MKRILVAYDGSEPARRALDTTIELAKASDALVTVVSVVPFHPGRVAIDPWDDPGVHARELREAKLILAAQGITAESVQPSGDPARQIEELAEEGGFDTIVLGSRGLGAVSRFLQGSVSEHVATHTRATVVISH